MKKLFLTLLGIIAFTTILFAQEDIKTYNGKISKVKVYMVQANVEKTTMFPLKKGNNEVILSGNSVYMQTESLQFTSDNDFIITDFTPYSQYVNPKPPTEEKLPLEKRNKLKVLRDSIELLYYNNADSYALTSILNKEKIVLENMKVISQPQLVDSIPKIKDALSYYRIKMLEVTKMLQKETIEINKRNQLTANINNQINLILQGEAKQEPSRNEYYIRLNIYSEKDIPQCKLSYSYNVTGVSWQPYYDVKFTKPTNPVAFVLKAQLTQQTGEDWNDVNLVFSTEQPNDQRVLGELYPYYLRERTPINLKQNLRGTGRAESAMQDDMEIQSISMSEKSVSNATNYSKMTVSQITMLGKEYEVGMKHSIPSDGKAKTISLETKKTPTDYKHYSIPKIDKSAYISALLPDWESLELMDATGKIYLEGSYINDTYINSNSTLDTLNLSIGADKRVAVDRKLTKSKPEKVGLLSSNAETIITITITVKNNNQTSIDLNLVDQIPLSNADNITITAGNLSKAAYDEKTGKLTWDLKFNPLEAKTIIFNYTVRHPKNANLFFN
ncbi:MAG TPA: DUF4139 domain-containing protein [Bacteroidales bacterium]|nr:DUF4139 domain-containing protein [Bacteroidales bacterium]